MSSPLRLLLIEDVEDHALLQVRELRKRGFDPDFERVDTLQELEAALDSGPWDAVISDFNLPGFNGLDALQLIQGRGLDLPFILVSGVIGEEKAVEAMKAGVHDYIMKGNYSRLAPALERELGEAAVRRERRQAVEELRLAHAELERRVAERTAELEEANALLRERETLLRTVTEGIPDLVFVKDREGRMLLANPATLAAIGKPAEEVLGKNDAEFFDDPAIGREIMENDRMVMASGSPRVLEETVQTPQGRRVFLSTKLPYRDDRGEIIGTIGVARDITERKRAEEALQKAHNELAVQMEERIRELQEKEVLLKEVHHRVKNNLQVISSLVNLQADGSPDETVREVLRDVTYRVRSMALVHEKLYHSATLSSVDFAEYAQSLLNYLWRAHGSAAASVRLSLELEPVSFPIDIAVPCGLILNELAGNALKHAFRGRDGGEVTVSLGANAECRVCLRVKDDGIGIPPELDWRQAKSLGLRLVQMLAGQLRAEVEVDRLGGTEFLITFNLPQKAKDGDRMHE